MKRSFFLLVSVATVLVLLNPTFAAPILDQYYTPDTFGWTSTISYQYTAAQSFTVGIDGILDRIELPIFSGGDYGSTEAPLKVDIWSGPPSTVGSPLISFLVSYDSLPVSSADPIQYTSLDLSSYHLLVASGDVLSVALDVEQGRSDPVIHTFYRWLVKDVDGYSGGQPYYQNFYSGSGLWVEVPNTEHGFKTYVSPVPEPATMLLLGSGLLGLAGLRRRFRK